MHYALERLRRAAAATAAVATTALSAVPAHQSAPERFGTAAVTLVSFQGYRFRVPRSWSVVDLTRQPRACVRFDRHVLYLGHPGPDEDCPGNAVGRTEALLVQPLGDARVAQGAVADPVAHEVQVTTARVEATATYGTDPGLVQRLLADAGLPAVGVDSPRAAAADWRSEPDAKLDASAASSGLPGVTDFTGKGFDACSAPSVATMRAWTGASPYHAVGVYVGGSQRACSEPNLTASWVRTLYAAGWRFLPLYVGEQAASISSPRSEGAAAAADAVARACRLGFGRGATLYYDMEAYGAEDSSKVLAFEAAWTQTLHAMGYHSGVYSSSGSGVRDLVDNYGGRVYAMPDVLFDALWNGAANTDDATVPVGDWGHHQRVHQYGGSVSETWGGVAQTVDRDYLDVRLSGFLGAVPGPASARIAGPGS
jgi:hypothetical protein